MKVERVSISDFNLNYPEPTGGLSIQTMNYSSKSVLSSFDGTLPEKETIESYIKSFFPIQDSLGNCLLNFAGCVIEEPKFSSEQCLEKFLTYQSSVYGLFDLILFDVDQYSGAKEIKSVKRQKVYLFDIPIMVNSGSFIVNGVERVIVSQIHRSPGVIFKSIVSAGQISYTSRIIPYRGSWLDIELDNKGQMFFRINKKRKLPITNLLLAVGLTKDEVLSLFFKKLSLQSTIISGEVMLSIKSSDLSDMINELSPIDIYNENLSFAIKANSRISKRLLSKSEILYIKPSDLSNFVLLTDMSDLNKAFVVSYLIDDLFTKTISSTKASYSFEIVFDQSASYSQILSDVFLKSFNSEDALRAIFKILRPGSPFSLDDAKSLMNYNFFDPKSYSLTSVGRYKINSTLSINIPNDVTVLTKEDISSTISHLIYLKRKNITVTDVDSLSNRRIKNSAELIENAIRTGLSKLTKSALERFNTSDIESILPNDVIYGNQINSEVKNFIALSQLSQFMDSTNPLSEIAHKRRISALGPGGISRERATFDVRDVHITHYGRVCPIETPEGQNIGLINNLASYAKVNEYGFLTTPYRVVKEGKITDEIVYLDPEEDFNSYIGSVVPSQIKNGNELPELVTGRRKGEFLSIDKNLVKYTELSPKQIVSIVASLIPFIENTDAGRALMGSNMQRQALPLIKPTAPLIGTGVESVIVNETPHVLRAKRDGVISSISGDKIYILSPDNDSKNLIDVYQLLKFRKTNHNTVIVQNPIVNVGDIVKKGDPITDGPAIDKNELALGRNLLVGFMTWNGYNFEDSIILSEKICASGAFTSVHIEEFSTSVRDTRLGPEELTRDIPNTSDNVVRFLDESGIIVKGAHVEPEDILVGKVTPKVQELLTPEEKLLKAVFGEKNSDVRDASLTVPPGVSGTVVDVKILTRRGVDKCTRALEIERERLISLADERDLRNSIIKSYFLPIIDEIIKGKELTLDSKNVKVDQAFLNSKSLELKLSLVSKDPSVNSKISDIKEKYKQITSENEKYYDSLASSIVDGEDLQQGVLAVVKVYVATKRMIQPGDKMAGRHGNKGVVSKVAPVEDMPFLEDGTPLDIVLSCLGIPSRMNIGQILETHLGMVSKELAKKIDLMMKNQKSIDEIKNLLRKVINSSNFDKMLKETPDDKMQEIFNQWSSFGVPFSCPPFESASVDKITDMLSKVGLDKSGQFDLYDGLTGVKFDRKVTIGYIYMLKLHHIVEEKIHARSIGSYSLITQQPLGGRSHFGGQRFGEMECWALQAYGAAYTLQEVLTVKSDDVTGRTKMYESIIKGDSSFTYGIPESFNVLIKELRSLGLSVDLEVDNII